MAKTVRTITKEVENVIVVPKTILITQPKPENDKSPYYELEKKYNISLQVISNLVYISSWLSHV